MVLNTASLSQLVLFLIVTNLDFSYPGNKNFNLVVIKKLWAFDHCFVAKN